MARIYISAPVTGYDYKERKQYFSRIEREIVKGGDSAVNPMRLICEGMSHEDAMRICIRHLLRCDEMIVYGDFYKSAGCIEEVFIALSIGMPVIGDLSLSARAANALCALKIDNYFNPFDMVKKIFSGEYRNLIDD